MRKKLLEAMRGIGISIPENSDIQEILHAYSLLYNSISIDQQEKLSLQFWGIIDSLKMPIIEIDHDESARVCFLYQEQKDTGKDLYIQGDFHGYGSTLPSQRLKRLDNTDVMYCITPMKKELQNALITYHFVEVPPEHRDHKADYFYKDHPELKIFVDTNWLPDLRGKHSKAFDKRESQFCVNKENDMSRWCAPEFCEWPTLTDIQKDTRLMHSVQKSDDQIVSGITSLFTDNHNLRSIQIFKPTEQVENIVIVNDGFAYLFCDSLSHLQRFAEKEKCVFIFVSQLGGLGNPNDHPLGLRGLEYHKNVDQYSAFILEKLLPELNKQGILPDPYPTNMTVVGASLSGTAALRMGLTHPNRFGRVIAHSPSPFSKEIIEQISDVTARAEQIQIDIECGQFENLDNAQNDNLSYAHELGKLLKVDVHVGLHGHQYEAWVVDINRSLAAIFNPEQKNAHKLESDPGVFSSTAMNHLLKLMNVSHIPGVSIAYVSSDETIAPIVLGHEDAGREKPITPETIFGAASLSKPVFIYLVLKLIAANKFKDKNKIGPGKFDLESFGLDQFDFNTPLHKILLHPQLIDDKDAEKITLGMVLSHMSGLPITDGGGKNPLKFDFLPGSNEYAYSGVAISYLQKVIEKLTHKSLQELAQKYVFDPLNMQNSSFVPKRSHGDEKNSLNVVQAANSLHTTASDYARFVTAWMNDEELQYAFQPVVFMTRDRWAKRQKVPLEDLLHVAWGLGWGLEIDDHGKAIRAYHSGDMNEWRAWVAMDLKKRTAIVYFSNSHNGHLLVDQIISPTIKLEHALNYFFQKYGFARNLEELEPSWQVKPNWGLRRQIVAFPSSETRYAFFPSPLLSSRLQPVSESWWENELRDKRSILEIFWNERVIKLKQQSIDGFKQHIIHTHFPSDAIWEEKINVLFSGVINQKMNFETFFHALKYIPMVRIRELASVEKLPISVPIQVKEVPFELEPSDLMNIKRYMVEKGISASVSFGSAQNTLLSPNFSGHTSSCFAMHSVGKVFTQMLVLKMIRQGILTEDDLNQPPKFDESVKKLLSLAVREQLEKVTLHQLMTHQAGLGDYLGSYFKAIGNGHIPEMKSTEDFLQFADSDVSAIGEHRYSNLGLLLVGLAVQHAYGAHYNTILQIQIIDEVGMPSFTPWRPHNAQVNSADRIAPHLVGSPAGGYWVTAEDLAKFGQWIYKQVQADPHLETLMQKYGQEFYSAEHRTVLHSGGIPSSSAFLSVSLATGNVAAVLSDQPDMAFELNSMIQNRIFYRRHMVREEGEESSIGFYKLHK